jgi:hypothetical protein
MYFVGAIRCFLLIILLSLIFIIETHLIYSIIIEFFSIFIITVGYENLKAGSFSPLKAASILGELC